jgi:hypothetical protein
MSWEQWGVEAASLIARLPAIPHPWSIDELCDRLAAQRGRELVLHSLNMPALPLGLWHNDGERDHIIYRAGIVGYHRDHIILHEICHMLAQHNSTGTRADAEHAESAEGSVAGLVERAVRNPYTDAQEELAEMFASKVLKQALRSRQGSVSDFERRAAAVFGVTA